MPRKFEVGPLLVTLGALLLVVSLFTTWYGGYASAWDVFEVWDVILLVIAIVAIFAAVSPFDNSPDRRLLATVCLAAFVIVASQIINPPFRESLAAGVWIALGATIVLGAGALLTLSRVRFSMTVAERESPGPLRQRVSAVDARGPADPATDDVPKVAVDEVDGSAAPTPPPPPASVAPVATEAADAAGGGRLFTRASSDPGPPTSEREPALPEGSDRGEPKQG